MPICKKGYYTGRVQKKSFLCNECTEDCFGAPKRVNARRKGTRSIITILDSDYPHREYPLEDVYLDEQVEVSKYLKVRKRNKWQIKRERKHEDPQTERGSWSDDHLW